MVSSLSEEAAIIFSTKFNLPGVTPSSRACATRFAPTASVITLASCSPSAIVSFATSSKSFASSSALSSLSEDVAIIIALSRTPLSRYPASDNSSIVNEIAFSILLCFKFLSGMFSIICVPSSFTPLADNTRSKRLIEYSMDGFTSKLT